MEPLFVNKFVLSKGQYLQYKKLFFYRFRTTWRLVMWFAGLCFMVFGYAYFDKSVVFSCCCFAIAAFCAYLGFEGYHFQNPYGYTQLNDINGGKPEFTVTFYGDYIENATQKTRAHIRYKEIKGIYCTVELIVLIAQRGEQGMKQGVFVEMAAFSNEELNDFASFITGKCPAADKKAFLKRFPQA